MTLDSSKYPLLSLVDEPAQLRDLAQDKLPAFSKELREYLLNSVSQSSGHLASGLGTVELTVALHYVYNTPEDRLVWDVGHQAYPHKILTGRRDQMHTIRQKDGLHPFPFREESPYDTFSVGHSSTSISAALGMAIAAEKEGKDRKTVAVIGDGAITAGMAFEAMNHMGDVNPNVLIILNDNEMSISENVGALNNHFARILSGSFYTNIREGSKKLLSGLPPVKELASRMEEHLKGMVIPGTFFEELGLNYIGPIDGHDVNMLVDTLRNMRNLKGPQLLHIKTQKGKGYKPAEADPIGYHGVPKFDPSMSKLPKSKPGAATFSNVFGDWLCDMAAQDDKLMAITPAMREGSGMVRFSKEYPAQYFDVAIAEQHAVTLAAGLACEGLKPVVAIYSSFLQRAYDQIIHDVCIDKYPVIFAIDRAGIVGQDGETHQGLFDIGYLKIIPNITIFAPRCFKTLEYAMDFAIKFRENATAFRYPRGAFYEVEAKATPFEYGKAEILKESNDIMLIGYGNGVGRAWQVMKLLEKEGIKVGVLDLRFIKPLDTELLKNLKAKTWFIFSDSAKKGGVAETLQAFSNENSLHKKIISFEIEDKFIPHGETKDVEKMLKIDIQSLANIVKEYING